MIEEWKPIVGYEGLYEVSNLGKVKSLKFGKEKIMKFTFYNSVYEKVQLSILNKQKKFYVNRLVAKAFIPNPNNLPCVLHKDETLDENGLLYNGMDNLWWGTYKENMEDKYKKGRQNNIFQKNHPKYMLGKFGKNHNRSLKVMQYKLDLNFIKEWDSIADVEKELGINHSNISKCCKGKAKSAGGFIWKY